jgi:hypothetical protein
VKLPQPRGELSAVTVEVLGGRGDRRRTLPSLAGDVVGEASDVLHDEDVQLTLFVMYALFYRGFDGVDDEWEWDPDVLTARAVLEEALTAAVRERVTVATPLPVGRGPVAEALFAMTAPGPGPSVARFIARRATVEQARELLVHRSVYQLKEADPHTWAVPRLEGRAKAALVEIQADEYGGGTPGRMHAELFARTMQGAGLDAQYGAYVEQVPAITLASLNLMSLFGLHRRWRGAITGHLAAFEMTSSIPNRLYGDGFRRLGFDEDTTWYFDEHVEADAVHEQVAGRDLAGSLAEQEPALVGDILFGAAACLALDELVGDRLLTCWEAGRTSLRQP